jgi:membrane protein
MAQAVIRLVRRSWRVLRAAAVAWFEHDAMRLGASVAFYAIFALAPTLLIAVSIAGAVFGAEAARGYIFGELEGLVGKEAAAGAQALLRSAWREPNDLFATAVAVGTLLVGATGVFVELRNALNTVWEVQPRPAQTAWTPILRARLAAFAMVLALGFLAMVSLLISAGISAAATLWAGPLEAYAILLRVLDTVVSLALLTAVFGLLLRFLPDEAPPSRAVLVGALTSSVLFAVGKNFIGLYLGSAGVTSAYGAAGSLVVLILWVYYTSQLLLFGAELGRAAAPGPTRERT